MNPSFEPSDDLLFRYLAGDASASEQRVVEQWAVASPGGQDRLDALAESVQRQRTAERDVAHAVDVQAGWDRVQQALHEPVFTNQSRPSIKPKHLPVRWAITACSAAVVVVGLMVTRLSTPEPASTHVYTTVPGQRATITLADGSRITLAPQTNVELAARTITVRGLAHFHIPASSSRPLTVLTTNAEARILGTTFTVRQYPGESVSRVVVADGKVGVRALHVTRNDAVEAVVTARMLADVGDSSVQVRRDIGVADYMGWSEGRLVFNETLLRDVVAELSRAYATRIVVPDSVLASKVLTMKASTDSQSLSLLLEFIGRATESHAVRSENGFILVPGRVASRTERLKRLPAQEIRYGR